MFTKRSHNRGLIFAGTVMAILLCAACSPKKIPYQYVADKAAEVFKVYLDVAKEQNERMNCEDTID